MELRDNTLDKLISNIMEYFIFLRINRSRFKLLINFELRLSLHPLYMLVRLILENIAISSGTTHEKGCEFCDVAIVELRSPI